MTQVWVMTHDSELTESACDHHFIFANAFNKTYYILL